MAARETRSKQPRTVQGKTQKSSAESVVHDNRREDGGPIDGLDFGVGVHSPLKAATIRRFRLNLHAGLRSVANIQPFDARVRYCGFAPSSGTTG
jgi:hypothetical protein